MGTAAFAWSEIHMYHTVLMHNEEKIFKDTNLLIDLCYNQYNKYV